MHVMFLALHPEEGCLSRYMSIVTQLVFLTFNHVNKGFLHLFFPRSMSWIFAFFWDQTLVLFGL